MNEKVESSPGLSTFQIIGIFHRLLAEKNPAALMLWGKTGIGKSQIQRQILQKLSDPKATWKPKAGATPSRALEVYNDWGLVDFRVSLREPTDLLGFPDLSQKVVDWRTPNELPVVGQEDRFPENGVLFLDEITHAPPTMQSACYSLVLDRRCGTHILLPGWRIVAASNLNSEKAYAYEMAAPLRTRFLHFHLRCSLEAFKQWGMSNGVDQRVLSFVSWNSDYLHKESSSSEETYPTPRGWKYASDLLAVFTNGEMPNVLAAALGPGAASVFLGFVNVYMSGITVNIPKMLAGKEEPPKLSISEPDKAWALSGRVISHVRENAEALPDAISFFCSKHWNDALEIGRTGLSDLKYAVGPAQFAAAYPRFHATCQERYGKML